MKILDLYLLRVIAAACGVAAIALVGFSVVMIFLQELGIFGGSKEKLGFVFALQSSLLSLPERAQEMMPATVLLGTLMGLGGLAAGSELTAMRACGLSIGHLVRASLMTGLLFGGVAWFLSEAVVPYSIDLSNQLRQQARKTTAPQFQGGLWLRENNRYIGIGKIFTETSLADIRIFAYDGLGRLNGDLAAERAIYEGSAWRLYSVRLTEITDERLTSTYFPFMDWQVSLSPDLLKLSAAKTTKLSSLGLLDYIDYLEANGLDASRYRWMFWRKQTIPLSVMVMALLAVPFVLGSQRSGGAGRRLFVGVLLGMGAYLLNDIVTRSGQVYGLSEWLANVLPPMVIAALAAALLRWRLSS